MDETIKEWIVALRSGKYKQGHNLLRSRNNEYCCLGVLCDISGSGYWNKRLYSGDMLNTTFEYIVHKNDELEAEIDHIPTILREKLNISIEEERQLINMNDGFDAAEIRKHTFSEIADYIEENL